MTDGRQAIPFEMIPYEDHVLIRRNLCTGSFDAMTVRSYLYSYRYAMGALLEDARELLDVPLASRFPTGADVVCADVLRYLRPVVAVGEIRQLRRVLAILLNEEVRCFDSSMSSIRDWAKEERLWDRGRARSISADLGADLPTPYRSMLANIRDGRKQDGTPLAAPSIDSGIRSFGLFLGVLERAGVDWRGVDPQDLLTGDNLQALVDAWCRGKGSWVRSQRLNELGCALKHMLPGRDVSAVFSAAAEVRKRNPDGHSARSVKVNVPTDEVPDEDLARFACACPGEARRRKLKFDFGMHARSFSFEGRRVRLEKHYGSSAMTETGLFDCLRAMVTALKISDPDLAKMSTEARDYDRVAEIFGHYYADKQPSTVVNRLECLKMLLKRILPTGTPLVKLEAMIKDAKAAVERADVVVPNLLPSTIRQVALDELGSSYAKFCDLRDAPVPYVSAMYFAEIFRDNLMIALLSHNPLRLGSIQSMVVGDVRSVTFDNAARRRIVIPANRTKAGESIRFFVPGSVEPWLDLYLTVVRGHIAPSHDGDAFWVTKDNKALSRGSIKKSIPQIMMSMHGIRVNIHLFRHIVATAEYDAGKDDSSLNNKAGIRDRHYIDSRVRAKASKETCLAHVFDEATEGLGVDFSDW